MAHGKFDAHSWQPASLYDAKKSSTIHVTLPAKPISPTIIAIDSPEAIERNMHLMGTSLLNAQKSREAIKLLKLCTAMNPRSWNSYNSLGEAYARTGNKKLAIRSYKKAIKLNPDNVSARQAILKLKQ